MGRFEGNLLTAAAQPGLVGFKISLCFCLDFGFQNFLNPQRPSRNGFLLGILCYPIQYKSPAIAIQAALLPILQPLDLPCSCGESATPADNSRPLFCPPVYGSWARSAQSKAQEIIKKSPEPTSQFFLCSGAPELESCFPCLPASRQKPALPHLARWGCPKATIY